MAFDLNSATPVEQPKKTFDLTTARPLDFSKSGSVAERGEIKEKQIEKEQTEADKIASAAIYGGTATLGGEATLAKFMPMGNIKAGAMLSMAQPVKATLAGASLSGVQQSIEDAIKFMFPDTSDLKAGAISTVGTLGGAAVATPVIKTAKTLLPQLTMGKRIMTESGNVIKANMPDVEIASQKMLNKLVKGDISKVSDDTLTKILEPFGAESAKIKSEILGREQRITNLKKDRENLNTERKIELENLIKEQKAYIEQLPSRLSNTRLASEYGRNRYLPNNPSEIGQQSRDKILIDLGKAQEHRAKEGAKDYNAMVDDALAKEKKGFSIRNTEAHKRIIGMIDSMNSKVNLPEYNNALLTLRKALTTGAEMTLDEGDRRVLALRRNVPLSTIPDKIFLEPTMEGMEIIRRKLNDVAFPAIGQPEGFKAINSKNAEKIANELEKSMSEFSAFGNSKGQNHYENYINTYKKNSEYINKIKTSFGQKFVEQEEGFYKTPAGKLIEEAFSSPDKYDHFVQILGNKALADEMASKYFARKFDGLKDTTQAFEFMKEHEAVLNKMPKLKQQLEGTINQLKIAEEKIAGIERMHGVETTEMEANRLEQEMLAKTNIGEAVKAKDIDAFLNKSGTSPDRLAYAVKASKDPIWRERIAQFINTREQKEAFVKAVSITLKDTPPSSVVEVYKREILPTLQKIGIHEETSMNEIRATIDTIDRLQNRTLVQEQLSNLTRRIMGIAGTKMLSSTDIVDRPITTIGKGIHGILNTFGLLPSGL